MIWTSRKGEGKNYLYIRMILIFKTRMCIEIFFNGKSRDFAENQFTKSVNRIYVYRISAYGKWIE